MRILFPITADILTPGHIKCIDYLARRGRVIISLLTDKALRGYKKNVVSYKDRKYILDCISDSFLNTFVVPQNSLDPTNNIIKYNIDAIASGDGFEKVELKAINMYKIRKIKITLPGEKNKKYGSSFIKNKILKK